MSSVRNANAQIYNCMVTRLIILISLNPVSETELVFKEDTDESAMIQEQSDDEKAACVVNAEEMGGNEEEQQPSLDQVDENFYDVYLCI